MKRRLPWPALLIVLIAVGTPLLATAVYFIAPPQQTTNRGELIEPLALPDGVLPPAPGGEAAWHLVALGEPACGLACRQRLCLLRQVRLVHLGESERIGRVWLLDGAGTPAAQLEMEPGCGRDLPAARTALKPVDILAGVTTTRLPAALRAALPAPAAGATLGDYLYLADPQGQLVMRYPASAPARDVAKDLGRLLRLSRRA